MRSVRAEEWMRSKYLSAIMLDKNGFTQTCLGREEETHTHVIIASIFDIYHQHGIAHKSI